MFVNKLKTALVFVLMLASIGGSGIGVYYLRAQALVSKPEPPVKKPEETAQDNKAAKAPEKKVDTLTKLMQERLKLAQQEAKVCQENYRSGKVQFEAIAPAAKHLLKAELELTTKKADRVAVYERYIKVMEELAKNAQAGYQAGLVSFSDQVKAQYLLIDAKIDLERDKARK